MQSYWVICAVGLTTAFVIFLVRRKNASTGGADKWGARDERNEIADVINGYDKHTMKIANEIRELKKKSRMINRKWDMKKEKLKARADRLSEEGRSAEDSAGDLEDAWD